MDLATKGSYLNAKKTAIHDKEEKSPQKMTKSGPRNDLKEKGTILNSIFGPGMFSDLYLLLKPGDRTSTVWDALGAEEF